MAAKDGTISSRLELDGEKQYKQALNDAYRSLRVLRSELKAETAEMGKNATEQDKARKKIESLKKQIVEQEKVVKTLTEAFKESQEQYKDNAEVQDKWAEKLNKAREQLANLKNQMDSAKGSLQGFSSDMKQAAQGADQAKQVVVSFNDSLKSIGSIVSGAGNALSGIFENTVSTMRSMVDEMFSLMSMAWSAAGDWKQIQTIWGGNLEDIEKVFTGMQSRGIDASEVTGGIQKLVQNVHAGNKDTMKALKQLGISEEEYDDHWTFFMAVMEKVAGKQGSERDKLVRQIFGDKKGSGMMDVVDNWQEAMSQYQEDFEKTGLALKSDEIERLDEVSHKITEIKTLWDGIKTNIGAKLSDVLNMDQISEDTMEVLRDIGKLISGEGDKKEITLKLQDDLKKVIENITAGLENLGGFLQELGGDLENSDSPILKAIGKLVSEAGKVLDWVSDNEETIGDLLAKVLPLMLQNKLVELTTGKGIGDWVTDIAELLTHIIGIKAIMNGAGGSGVVMATSSLKGLGEVIKGLLFGGGASGAAGSAGASGAAGAAGGAAKTVVDPTKDSRTSSFTKGMIDKFGVPALSTAAKVGGTLANVAGLGIMGGTMLLDKTSWGQALMNGQGIEGAVKAIETDLQRTFSDENKQAFAENWDIHGENANPIAKGIGAGVDWVKGLPEAVNKGVIEPVKSFVEDNVDNMIRFWQWDLDNTGRFFEGAWNDGVDWVTKLGEGVWNDSVEFVKKISEDVSEKLKQMFSDENKQAFAENWDIHGENANPIAKGIGAGVDWVKGLPEAVNKGVIEPVKSFVEDNVDNMIRFWQWDLDNTGRFFEGAWNDGVDWVTMLGNDVAEVMAPVIMPIVEGLARMFENPASKSARNHARDQLEMGGTPSPENSIVLDLTDKRKQIDLFGELMQKWASDTMANLAEQSEKQKQAEKEAQEERLLKWFDEFREEVTKPEETDTMKQWEMQELFGDPFSEVWNNINNDFEEMDISGGMAGLMMIRDYVNELVGYVRDKYTGDTKNEPDQPIEIVITANTNLDGRTIASEVSRYVASGINYRITRI